MTSLLKHSLGGNSYCLMIACVSPAEKYLPETISTLHYATRAGKIKNEPQKNVDPKIKIIEQLQGKVEGLQRELKQANEHIEYLSQLLEQKHQQQPPASDRGGKKGVLSPEKSSLLLLQSKAPEP